MSGEIYFDGARYLSAKEAARVANVTRDYITRLARSGKIKSRRVLKHWFVEDKSLNEYLVAQGHAAEERKSDLADDRKREYRASQFALKEPPPVHPVVPVAAAASPTASRHSHPGKEIPRVHTMRHAIERHAPKSILRGGMRMVPLYVAHPAFDLAHKAAAIVTCFVLVLGAYAYANPEPFRYAIGSMRGADAEVALVDTKKAAGQTAAVSSSGVFGVIADFFGAIFNRDRGAVQLTIESYQGAPAPRAVQAAPTVPPVQQTIVNQPVVERVIETVRTITSAGSDALVNAQLALLSSRIDDLARLLDVRVDGIIRSFEDGGSGGGNFIGGSLEDLTISNSSWTGGSITGATITGGSIDATALTGVVGVANGGTATSTAPDYGQMLVGDGAGGYTLMATSTLGIIGAASSPGGATGDVQYNNAGTFAAESAFSYSAADNRLTVPFASTTVLSAGTLCLGADCQTAWPSGGGSEPFPGNATTTQLAFNGGLTATNATTTNLHITGLANALLATDANGRVFSTTTIGANLINTSGNWTGTFDGQEGSFYLANSFSTTSASNFSALGLAFSTTSNDYWQTQRNFFSTTSADFYTSVTNFFSTTSAIHFVHSSTTIPKTYTANTFTGLQTFGNSSTTLASFSYASSTLWYGGGLLANCDTGNLLTWTDGRFGCAADQVGGGGGAEPFPGNATSSVLTFTNGLMAFGSSTISSLSITNSTTTNATTSRLAITSLPNSLLATNSDGTVIATTSIGSNLINTSGDWTGTLDGQEGSFYLANSFSTTSAAHFSSLGLAFSTTSASHFSSLGLAFSTTSNDYWQTQRNFFSTTSADFYTSVTNFFSTTSAIHFVHSSTTIPKTYTSNIFTNTNMFLASTTIGDGTAAGGLTISGGATTTGNILGQGSLTISGTTLLGGTVTATGGLTTLSNLLLTGSTTLQNFTAVNSTTTNATTTNLGITSLLSFGGVTGSSWSDFCESITGGSGLCDGSDNTGSGGSGLATSTDIADTWIIYGTSADDVGAESAFTYDDATNRFTVDYASTTALSTLYASSTSLFAGTLTLPGLGTPAGAFLAVDANGQVIATTTPTGGSGGTDFTFTSNFGALNAATSSILWAKNGINASSTSRLVDINLYGTLNFTPTTATTPILATFDSLPFITASSTTWSTSVGRNALGSLVSGGTNSAFGDHALADLVSGNQNTAIGYIAMLNSTSTFRNTAVGAEAMFCQNEPECSGHENVAIGYAALREHGKSAGNVAIGIESMAATVEGEANVALGSGAMTFMQTGFFNTAVGKDALRLATTSGGLNTAVGTGALFGNSTGLEVTGGGNTAVGLNAGARFAAGSNNTLLGRSAGVDITNGNQNIIIGYQETDDTGITTGSNNILLGYDIRAGLNRTGSNQLNIGNLLFGTGLGSGTTYGTGNIGIGTSTPYSRLSVWGSSSLFEAVTAASSTIFSIGQNGATTTGFAITSLPNALLATDASGNVYATTSIYAASSTLLADHNTWTGTNMFLASTTIGNGTQAGGLTVSGGATTTGNILGQGKLTISGTATSTFAGQVRIGSSVSGFGAANKKLQITGTDRALIEFIATDGSPDVQGFIGARSAGGFDALQIGTEMDAGVRFFANNALQMTVSTGGVAFGDVLVTADERLRIEGDDTGEELVVGDDVWDANDASIRAQIGNTDGNSTIRFGQSTSNFGFLGWTYNATPANAYLTIGANSGSNPLVLQEFGGNVGIGTTSPYAKLSVVGQVVGSHFTATTTATSTFPTLSVTGRLYDGAGTGGVNGSILQTTGTGVQWVATSTLGFLSEAFRDWSIQGGGYLAPTTTRGVIVAASSTIGNGTAAGGLTISGGATTTGNALFSGNVSIPNGEFVVQNSGLFFSLDSGGGAMSSDDFSMSATGANTTIFHFGIDQPTIIGAYDGGTPENVLIVPNDPSISAGSGLVAIGTTSPYAKLSLWDNDAAGTIFEAVTSASSTVFSIGQNGATTTGLAITSVPNALLATDASGNVYATTSIYAASSTLLADHNTWTGTNMFLASTTIGNGTRSGGLTISGGATTTGIAYFANKIGIGTSTPFGNSELEIADGDFARLRLVATDSSPDVEAIIDARGDGTFNGMQIATNSNHDIRFFTNSTFAMALTNGGNLGIGPTATAPDERVFIEGNDSGEELVVGEDIWDANDTTNRIQLGNSNGNSALRIGQGSSNYGFLTWVYNATPANAYFSVSTISGNNPIVLQEQGNNVGIGTTSPYAKLSVVGQVVGSHFTATTTATSTFPTLSVTGRLYDGAGTGGTNGSILQTTGTGVQWVATSTLGFLSEAFRDWSIQGDGYLAPTTTRGVIVAASSTIGAGTQATGLTISGGATTTGRAYFAGAVGISSTTPGSNFVVQRPFGSTNTDIFTVASSTAADGSTAVNRLSVSGSGFGTTTVSGLDINGSATTTSNVGVRIASGCYAMPNGNCIVSSTLSGSDASSAGSLGAPRRLTYWTAADTISSHTNLTFDGSTLVAPEIQASTQNPFFYVNDTDTATADFQIAAFDGQARISVDVNNSEADSYLGFNIDGAEQMRLTNAGRLGIGTTTPRWLLQLASSTAPQLALSDGSASSPHWTFRNAGGNLYLASTSPSTFATSTLPAALTINGTSGNIGIASSTPWAQLSVNALSGNSSPLFAVGSTTNTALLVTNTGNVGIGTTSPYAKLSVVGPIVAEYFHATSTSATSTFAGGLNINNGAITHDFSAGLTSIDNLAIGALSFSPDSGIVTWTDMPVTSVSATGTVNSYSAKIDGTDILTIYSVSDGAGGIQSTTTRVGIGTTSPLAKLAVQANAGQTNSILTVASSSGESYLSLSSDGITTLTNLLLTGSTTLQNFTAVNSTTTRATTTALAITGVTNALLSTNSSGSVVATTSLGLNLFSDGVNAFIHASTTIPKTYTSNIFTNTNMFLASTTIGAGTQATGLTISGGATTTQNLSVLGTGNSYFTGNLGIGTTSPYAKLSVVGEAVARNFTATSTTATSTFAGGLNVNNGAILHDFSSGLTSIENLTFGAMEFDADSGVISWTDMPVTSDSTAGTVNSYTAQIDGNPALTVYSISTGGGNTASTSVGIGTTTPTTLYGGTFASAGPIYVGGPTSTATSTFEGNLHVHGTLKVGTSSIYITENGISSSVSQPFAISTNGSSNALSVSNTGFGTTTVTGLAVNGSATSTSNVGFNLTGGCFAIGGTCISGGGGSSNWSDAGDYLTPLTVTDGIIVAASTTIGNGTAAGGLTISGSATTTGNIIGRGNLDVNNGSAFVQLNGSNFFWTFTDGGILALSGANTTALRYQIDSPTILSGYDDGVAEHVLIQPGGSGFGSGLVGIGTTSPYAKLSLWDNDASGTIFEAVTSASTTVFSVGQNGATTTGLAITSVPNALLATDASGNVYATTSISSSLISGSVAAASTTLLTDVNTWTGTNMFLASTTIGNGTAAGGLTISGSATTTGSLLVQGTASTSKFFADGLTSCTGDNYLTWSAGTFGCDADDQGAGGGSEFSFLTVQGSLAAATSSRFAVLNTSYFGATGTTTITSAGFVGIGTTSPFAKLSIHALNGETNGTLFVIASSTASATTSLFAISNTGTATFGENGGAGDATFQMGNDTDAWAIGYNASDKSFRIASSTSLGSNVALTIAKTGLVISGDFNDTSDARLKKNIEDIAPADGLEAIRKLRPVSFEYIDPERRDGAQYGFIAQEVGEIFPTLVATTSPTALTPDGTVVLKYTGLIAPTIFAVQQLDLNLSALASTTLALDLTGSSTAATSTSATTTAQSYASSFFRNLFARTATWLASAQNGITEIFAKTIRAENVYADTVTTKELCIEEDGLTTCVTKAQLDALLNGQVAGASSGGSGEPEPPPPADIMGTSTPPADDTASSTPPADDTGTSTPPTGGGPQDPPADEEESETPPAEDEPSEESEEPEEEESEPAPEPAPTPEPSTSPDASQGEPAGTPQP